MKQGSVYWCEFDPARDSEIRKTRPAVIVSNNEANRALTRVVVIPLSSNIKQSYPSEAIVSVNKSPHKAIADQIRTMAKSRIKEKIGELTPLDMEKVKIIIRRHLDL
jgi:mRNA interferase MazF